MRKLSQFFEKFSKIFEIFFKKLARKLQKCIILAFFPKLVKHCVQFSRVWTKNTKGRKFLINFRKHLTIFQKLVARKLQKCIILAYIAKFLKTMRSIFARLDEKFKWLGKF